MGLSQFYGKLQKVKKYDRYIAGLCPYHEDSTPSLLVFDDGWFQCLACNKRGTHQTLMDKLDGTPSHLAGREATSEYESGLPYVPDGWSEMEQFAWDAHSFLLKEKSVGWYLRMRGIEDRVVPNSIGWSNGWYTFPILSKEGYFNGMVLRASASVQRNTGHRYYIPPGQKPRIYVPDWKLVRSSSKIFVVYGIIDALVMTSLGIPTVTTSGGKVTFSPDWVNEYRGRIYVLPDKGEEDTALHLVGQLGWRGSMVKLEYPEEYKDPADFVQFGDSDLLYDLLRPLMENE